MFSSYFCHQLHHNSQSDLVQVLCLLKRGECVRVTAKFRSASPGNPPCGRAVSQSLAYQEWALTRWLGLSVLGSLVGSTPIGDRAPFHPQCKELTGWRFGSFGVFNIYASPPLRPHGGYRRQNEDDSCLGTVLDQGLGPSQSLVSATNGASSSFPL